MMPSHGDIMLLLGFTDAYAYEFERDEGDDDAEDRSGYVD